MTVNLQELLPEIIQIAKQAGAAILEYYHAHLQMVVSLKSDNTPVTTADLKAHEIIRDHLAKLTPDIPLLSEEGASIPFEERTKWPSYWLVDPLDGTREFIERRGEFTVNIALIENHNSILGVIYAPLRDRLYYASRNQGAFKQDKDELPQRINVRQLEPGVFKIVASRKHNDPRLEQILNEHAQIETIFRGSSLKFGLIADGRADIYLRIKPLSEWDCGAGQCVVEEAKGAVLDLNWQPLRYNTKPLLVNPPFIVLGDYKKLLPIVQKMRCLSNEE